MDKERGTIAFSRLFILNKDNVSSLTVAASLYMICKRDTDGSDQVIFAGVGSNLKLELSRYLDKNPPVSNLYFCYIPTTAKNVLKNSKAPLYQRVA